MVNAASAMAGDESSLLTGISFLASFLWLSHSLDRHSLADQPRLSAFLVLLVTGASAFLLSFFSRRLPGADGRFDSEAVFKGLKSSLPQRPRRFYIPCIILLVAIRLEIIHRVVYDFQCTMRGVEAFLPLLLALHEFFFNRKPYQQVVSDDPEDPWGSIWDDLMDWAGRSPILMLFSTLLFTYGVFLVSDFAPHSTYSCSPTSDKMSWIILLQWLGVFIDAAILILLWRVLSWARTTKSRLRTLSGVITASSLASGLLWLSSRLFQSVPIMSTQNFRGIDSIFIFDILSSGLTCAVFTVSMTLWICEMAPLNITATTTFMSGLLTTIHEVALVGSYRQASTFQPLMVLSIISTGYCMFLYSTHMRWVLNVPRIGLLLFLACLILGSTLASLLRTKTVDRHPINEVVYKNRIEADRWLRHATVSTTLKLAVSEYKERHHGRDPPSNFDKWYDFAMSRKSVIIDKYDQIEEDIFPFWGMKPSKIHEGLEIAQSLPDIGIIKIHDGKVSHNEPADTSDRLMLDDAIAMISTFAQHLPEMSIVVNLRDRPRVLTPWDDIQRMKKTALAPKFKLVSRGLDTRQEEQGDPEIGLNEKSIDATAGSLQRPFVSPRVFRRLQSLACPPGSKSRAGVTWNVRDHCASCADPHSQGQFVIDWEYSLDPCHQPDVFHLHDFYTLPHHYDLYQDLLPVFSRSKTDGFNDILIPLLRSNSSLHPDKGRFEAKVDRLFWQQEPPIQDVTQQSLHGGHQYRFVRSTNQATAFDKQSMLIQVSKGPGSKFAYQNVGTREVNQRLPREISYVYPGSCEEASCQVVLNEHFGFRPKENMLDNRYVMVLDTADGPSPDTLTVLGSNSVPFISTIFREWFTERLMPWTHFVPIDIRYHGLHSTLAYFVGLKGRGKINGEDQIMEPEGKDGKWIAEQGRKWAETAIRREDMEVYMFRLLLEWGRVMSDDRDNMVFSL
ncbi:capsular associated protein [Xylariales sp. PMI_506]|nr:capsular associated protein [Xylariales sp. PMI_506]